VARSVRFPVGSHLCASNVVGVGPVNELAVARRVRKRFIQAMHRYVPQVLLRSLSRVVVFVEGKKKVYNSRTSAFP